MRYRSVIAAACAQPWLVRREKLDQIIAVLEERGDPEYASSRQRDEERRAPQRHGAVAVLPVRGTIVPRADLFTDVSGLTNAESLGANFDSLVADPGVVSIVLDVDSPGGYSQGVAELADKIYAARGRKPIVAVANHEAASAAYWIASAADELVVTPTGEVGSVGVWSMHVDQSQAIEREGLNLTVYSAGKYKTEGNPWGPPSEETNRYFQSRVEQTYGDFLGAVRRNRGSANAARSGGMFGDGRMLRSDEAVSAGMADKIGTLQDVIGSLATTGSTDDLRRRRAKMYRLLDNAARSL